MYILEFKNLSSDILSDILKYYKYTLKIDLKILEIDIFAISAIENYLRNFYGIIITISPNKLQIYHEDVLVYEITSDFGYEFLKFNAIEVIIKKLLK